MRLLLRPVGVADERVFTAAHLAMAAEGFAFGHGFEPGVSWDGYLGRLTGLRVEGGLGGLVPTTFLLAEVGGAVVGRTSVRHELDAALTRVGGHIGYCVLPPHRRRGYATEILRQSLVVARSVGVVRVLVTCDDDNHPSRRVIETCGGRLDPSSDGGTLRYWIEPD
jgi:RimJ/RimL family protein N-acetyltransferase